MTPRPGTKGRKAAETKGLRQVGGRRGQARAGRAAGGEATGNGCGRAEEEAAALPRPALARSDPVDYSPPGSSTHGIFQARELEWGVIAFSMTQDCWGIKWQSVPRM